MCLMNPTGRINNIKSKFKMQQRQQPSDDALEAGEHEIN